MARVQEWVILLPGEEDCRAVKLVKRCIQDKINGTYHKGKIAPPLVYQQLILKHLLRDGKVDAQEISTEASRGMADFDEKAFSNSLSAVKDQCAQLEALLTLLRCIRRRCQENFSNRLVVEYDVPDIIFKWLNSSVAYVCEVLRERWILRPRKVRGLFGITPLLGRQFYGGDLNDNMIYCAVEDLSILPIVREELLIYATTVKAAGVKFVEVKGTAKIEDIVFFD